MWCVTDDKGQASLRLRIDDVSKNHQKQAFMIQIAPDTNSHPLNNDISPDECSALEVRSKRNKTKRPRDEDSSSTATASGGGNAAAQKIAIVNADYNSRVSAITLAASALATSSSGKKNSTPTATSAQGAAAAAAAAAAKGPKPANTTLPQASADIQTLSRSVLEKTALENKRLNDLMSNFDKNEEQRGAAASREQVGEAITGLVEWSQAMMDAVASLQWQLIGNEKLADGGVRPLYEMQNPNNTITSLFNRYHDFAVPGLTMLYHSHFSQGEGTSSSSGSSSSGANSSGSGSGSGGLNASAGTMKNEAKSSRDVGESRPEILVNGMCG